MKLNALLPLFLLTACANMPVPVSSDEDAAETPVEAPKKSDALLDKVQELVAKTQEAAISSLPAEITANKSTYKTVESVADREKNQKGAGFTRDRSVDGQAFAGIFRYAGFGVVRFGGRRRKERARFALGGAEIPSAGNAGFL